MGLRDWLATARGLTSIARQLARCADALERLADHAEGRPRRAPGEEPLFDVLTTGDEELSRLYEDDRKRGLASDEHKPQQEWEPVQDIGPPDRES